MSHPVAEPGPVESMMASDAASRALGITLLDYGDGWARATMTVTGDMVNGHGICHGAMIFALADTTFACACNSWGPVTVAAGADIVFIGPDRRPPDRRRPGTRPLRPQRALRHHGQPRRRAHRRVPRPQPPARGAAGV